MISRTDHAECVPITINRRNDAQTGGSPLAASGEDQRRAAQDGACLHGRDLVSCVQHTWMSLGEIAAGSSAQS